MFFSSNGEYDFLSAEHVKQSVKYLCTAEISGSFYTDDIKRGAKSASIGDSIELRREKDNKYDLSAVAVYNEKNIKLGYISKRENAAVAKVMDSGKAYCFGKISHVNIKRSSVGLAARLFFMCDDEHVAELKNIIQQNLR